MLQWISEPIGLSLSSSASCCRLVPENGRVVTENATTTTSFWRTWAGLRADQVPLGDPPAGVQSPPLVTSQPCLGAIAVGALQNPPNPNKNVDGIRSQHDVSKC